MATEQEQILLEISKHAASTKYKMPLPKNAMAIHMVDIAKLIEYLRENYNIEKKSP